MNKISKNLEFFTKSSTLWAKFNPRGSKFTTHCVNFVSFLQQ